MATSKGKPKAPAKAKPKKPAAKKPAVKKAAPRRAPAKPARAAKPAAKSAKAPARAKRAPEPAEKILIEPPDLSDTINANVPLEADDLELPAEASAETPAEDAPPAEDEEEPAPEEPEADEGLVSFEGVLTPNQPAGTYIPLTRDQTERFPGSGIVHVKGRVGGVPILSSLMPMGDGTHALGVHKATMEQGGFHHGDKVKVAIRLDTAPREVVVPKDFSDALEKSPKARRTFANYAFSHRKEYVNWIEEAKQPETRQRRIDQAVRMIEANEKLS